MKLPLASPTSDKGFTVLEMIIGISMTLAVSALALSALTNAERGFTKDRNIIEGGQKLSSILEIVGRDIVQAGEEINDPRFPVIQVAPDGSKGSRLIIYRGLEEALSLCSALPAPNVALTAGSNVTSLSLTATNNGVQLENSSCIPVPTFVPVAPATIPPTFTTTRTFPVNVQDWRTRRLAAGGQLPFFLHDGQGNIQLVNLTGETSADNFDTVSLTTSAFTPLINFPNRSTLNLVEKREYLICGSELKVRINNSLEGSCLDTGLGEDTVTFPFKTVATNISRMDITLTTANTPTIAVPAPPTVERLNESFPINTPDILSWRNLRGVAVEITAINTDPDSPDPNITAAGRFYPRNILSTNVQ